MIVVGTGGRERAMRNNACFLSKFVHNERLLQHRLIPNVPRVVFVIGAIAVVTAVALVQPGPAKEPANFARGAQARVDPIWWRSTLSQPAGFCGDLAWANRSSGGHILSAAR
jgi:hypothetical protein